MAGLLNLLLVMAGNASDFASRVGPAPPGECQDGSDGAKDQVITGDTYEAAGGVVSRTPSAVWAQPQICVSGPGRLEEPLAVGEGEGAMECPQRGGDASGDPLRLAELGPRARATVVESCREIRAAARHGFQVLAYSEHAEAFNAEELRRSAEAEVPAGFSACLAVAWRTARTHFSRPPTQGSNAMGPQVRVTVEGQASTDRTSGTGRQSRGRESAGNGEPPPEGQFSGDLGKYDGVPGPAPSVVQRMVGGLKAGRTWGIGAWRCLMEQTDGIRATVGRTLPRADPEVLLGMADDLPAADWLILQATRLFRPSRFETRVPQTKFLASSTDHALAERLEACLACA